MLLQICQLVATFKMSYSLGISARVNQWHIQLDVPALQNELYAIYSPFVHVWVFLHLYQRKLKRLEMNFQKAVNYPAKD